MNLSDEFKTLGETPVNKVLKKSPHGWVQWKGTNVCMDVYCKCGEPTHIDADFLYFLKCGSCGTVYELNGHIELIERIEPHSEDEVQTTDI